jgi:hypothetical protein
LKAAQDFDRALQLNPDDHWIWFRSVSVRLQLGDGSTLSLSRQAPQSDGAIGVAG